MFARAATIAALTTLLATTPLLSQANGDSGRESKINLSVGTGVLLMPRIEDGVSQASWEFEAAQQYRATVDRYVGGSTHMGLGVSWAQLPLRYARFQATASQVIPCPSSCDATADLFSVSGFVRVQSETRLHQVFETQVGVTVFDNFLEDWSGKEIHDNGPNRDFTLLMGYGVGFRVVGNASVSLMGDVGLTIHGKSGQHSDVNSVDQIVGARLIFRSGLF